MRRIGLSALLCAITLMLMTSAAMAGCTWYASPAGVNSNSGKSPSSPIPLKKAAQNSQPGDVVCLMAGKYLVDTPFEIPNSGTAANWITYTNYKGTAAVILPNSGWVALFRLGSGVRYIEINGLQFDGQDTANTAIGCSGCDHLRVIGNKVSHMGASGIISYKDAVTGKTPDYITVDHNQVYHCGYNQGWGSAISFARHAWSDSYSGFHSFVTNNIISGMYDNSTHKTDGNGIIMDNQPGDDTPPVLIANNVVYQNGRRCIHSRYASRIWMVNNTCYKNGLDLPDGEFQLLSTSHNYAVNNLSFGWNDRDPYLDGQPVADNRYHYNQWIASGTGKPHVVPPGLIKDPTALKQANPLFVKPPYVSPDGQEQYKNAVPPDRITDQFHLKSASPAIAAGIDPTTLPGISADIISGLKAHVFTDIEGKPRQPGSQFDLGAYASSGRTSSSTLTPVADTYVDSSNPDTNYGLSPQLKIGGQRAVRIAYLKFDLSALAGKTVISAHLQLWVYNPAQGTYSVSPVSDTSWTELGTTYSNRPRRGHATASVTSPTADTWTDFDVTEQVKASLGNLASIAISSRSSHTLDLDSREVSYQKPKLIVKYR
jgi:hypothetical protein